MDIQEKAAQIVATAQIVTLASIDENGYPRPVAMVKLKDEDGAIYVSTGTSSAKTAHFRANPKAGISIAFPLIFHICRTKLRSKTKYSPSQR